MASMVTDLAKTFVEKLINGAIAESRFVCCLACIAEEYEEEKVRLEAERTTVRQRAKVATRRGDDIQANARLWEEEADKLISEEDTKTKLKCFYGLCPDCIWRYKRGKKLANKTEQIKKLIEKGERLENVGLPSHLPGVERYSSQHYISFKSRESKQKELLDALADDSNYIIGLQGMGGTGKTTLAKEVGKELKQSEQFSQVIDTTVSFTPDIKKIQDDIAGPLGLKWEDCNESDRPKKLWSRLTNGEKILVILDDVWDREPPLNFDAIGIPKRDNHKGCRVLVTTRSKRVFNNMDCDKVIELELLSEEEAWMMFKSYAGISDGSSKSLIEKGRKIAKECKRLPVAIAVIASSLKGQQHRGHEWNATLKSLKKHVTSVHGVDDDLVGVYKCLKFSYDNMRDVKAKGLFLLCSLFPEGEEISIEILTRLGTGAGILGEDYGSFDDARNQVVVTKNKLVDSCLLLEAGEGYVKMHDLVRDAARWIKKEEIRAVNLSLKDPKSLVEGENNTTAKYMLCEGKVMDVFYSRFDCSNLEVLIAFFDMEVDRDYVQVEAPNSLFENIARLRALHLNNKGSSRDQLALSLPRSILSLTNIRSVLVDAVDLGDISVFGNLQSLETLDLVDCAINELPLEITKLKKFKLLNLEDCEIRRNNPFQVIGGCSSLEELYFIDSFNSFCQEITFPKLHRYHVCRDLGWVISNESQSKCVAFDADGDGDVGFFSEETFKYCMQTTEVLHLRRVKGEWRNIIPDIVPIDQGMNDLVELGLRGISQLQCLIDTNASHATNVFSKLVELRLDRMENLEALCNGPISFDLLKSLEKIWITDCRDFRRLFTCKLNLCNLKRMRLEECPMLVSLLQLSTSRSLILLEELRIVNCERLESIIIIDDDERGEGESEVAVVDGDNKSCGSMFPKLKSLYIYGCPKLECILPFLSACDLPVLETIGIRKCDGLKYIFRQGVELGSLKRMYLDKLPNFIDIFPKCYLRMSSSVKGSSSAYRDGSKPQTQSDPIKCNSFSWSHICCYGHKDKHKLRTITSTNLPFVSEDLSYDCTLALASNPYRRHIWERAQCLPIQPHILCNIKEIELSHFSKIKSMFVLSIAPRMLLETLTIMNCDELKHIIIDSGEDNGGNNWENVFPKLKELYVENCGQLEYIFGHYPLDHQNNNEIHLHLHLPVLKRLKLCKLPSLVAMCPKNYRTTFPPLIELQFDKCSQFAIKSIGDFIYHSIPRSLDSTSIKELSGNMEHFRALERLKVHNAQVENIFCLHEINGQLMNLALQNIELRDLLVMTYLFKGPKNSFNLQNLVKINIVRCEKLKIIFSTSIIRCLPQMVDLRIEECMELKHIIEYDDMENQKMSNSRSSRTCFPKLKGLAIVKCNKLKCVFPDSICKRLPELKVMMIREADELEEIFRSEGDHNVEIPNLKAVAFVSLPSLCQTQGVQFRAVEYRFVQNCQKLCLTSTPTQTNIRYVLGYDIDFELRMQLGSLFEQLQKDSKKQDTSNENPSPRTIKDIAAGVEVEAVLAHELTSSQMNPKQIPEAEQEFVEKVTGLEIPSMAILPTNSEVNCSELLNEQSMGQQYPLGEIDTTVKASQGNNNSLKETEDKSIQEGAASEETATTLSTNSETRNEPPIQLVAPKQKGIKRNDEEGTTFANAKTITSSTHLESSSSSSGLLVTSKCKTSSQDDGDGQTVIPSFSIATEDVDGRGSQKSIETNDQVSLNDGAAVKMSLIIEEQHSVSKDEEIRASESKPFLSIIPSAVASQSPSIASKGNPSQIAEDLSFSSLIIRELQQLASEKHLAYENLSLLTDFLVKHPSVHLTNNSLTNRFKGYAYNRLAELLKFLQTHSVLDVLGSNHSEFVELLQDVRICAFNKEWLDGVEKRALFPDLQVSQDQDALQKLLHSKQQVTKEVEMLRLKISIFTQQVEDLKNQLTSSQAVLESIIQQEVQVLEARAALSAPLGY